MLCAADGLHLPRAFNFRLVSSAGPPACGAQGPTSAGRAPRDPVPWASTRGGTSRGQRWRAPARTWRGGPAADARAQGRATCWGPKRSAAALRVGVRLQPHVRAARTPPPPTHVRATAPSWRPAQPRPRPGSGPRHREAARRPPRAAEGRGRRPHCSSPSGGPSPSPSPGRGAGPPKPRNVGSRPAFVSRARAAAAPRRPPEPLCAAGRGGRGRGARSRRAQPQHGRDGLRAHGALPAEPAGDLGECARLPAPLLGHRLLSRPPAVAADRSQAGPRVAPGTQRTHEAPRLAVGSVSGVWRCFQL